MTTIRISESIMGLIGAEQRAALNQLGKRLMASNSLSA